MQGLPVLKIIVAILIAMATSPVFAKDCEKGATNMAQVRACAGDESDRELAVAFNRTLSFVQSKDPRAATLLSAAQKSWKKFAEDSCEYTLAARQTEGMANDARLMCWQSFVDARVKVLDAYRKQFGNPDAR
jgi:uncharacterized protein YecT (DUF1311 family)